jgi:hypothetical protein
VYTKGRDPDIDGKVGDKTLAALEKAGLDVHKIHAAAFQQELKEEVLRNLTKNKKRVQEALTRYKKEGALHSNAFTRLKEMVHYDEKLGEKQLFLRQQYNTLYARNLDEKSVTAPRITPELMQQVHAITEAHKTVVESRIYLRMLYPELNIVYPDPEHKVLYPPNPEESRYYFNLYEIASKTDAEIYAKLDQGFNDITAAIENVREEVTNDSFPLEKLDPAIDRVLSRHEKNTRFIQDARTWQAEELEKEQEYNFKGTVLTIGLSVAGILAAPFSGGASLLLLLGGSLSGLATSAYNFERANDLYNAGVSSTYADAHLIENLELLRYNRTIAYVNLVFSIVDTFLAAKGFSKALQMRKTAKANISAAMKVKIVDEVVKVNIPQGLSKNQFKIASNLIRQKAGFISDDILVHGSRANYTSSITSDIDFAIRVSPEKFDRMIKQCFKNPNIGSAKEKTMLHAIKTGKIQAGEAGLRSLRKELKRTLGMNVDISIIKKGGPFDKGPYMKLTD